MTDRILLFVRFSLYPANSLTTAYIFPLVEMIVVVDTSRERDPHCRLLTRHTYTVCSIVSIMSSVTDDAKQIEIELRRWFTLNAHSRSNR